MNIKKKEILLLIHDYNKNRIQDKHQNFYLQNLILLSHYSRFEVYSFIIRQNEAKKLFERIINAHQKIHCKIRIDIYKSNEILNKKGKWDFEIVIYSG